MSDNGVVSGNLEVCDVESLNVKERQAVIMAGKIIQDSKEMVLGDELLILSDNSEIKSLVVTVMEQKETAASEVQERLDRALKKGGIMPEDVVVGYLIVSSEESDASNSINELLKKQG
jgi:dissimilatory sulfite reductase (desulfoviridin) alpha/beta subunit